MNLKINFEKQNGLIPVVAQDYKTNRVLMLAYMNEEAYKKTIETGKVTYWSRSRNKLWVKGESSGNFQILKELYVDCDEDAIVVKIEQIGGAACHTGRESCFYRKKEGDEFKIIDNPIFDPKKVYGEK